MQRYLKGLETWLNKWRLKIAPHKCLYNINRGNVPNLNELPNRSLIIFSEKIPIDNNPKYLGVTMDKNLLYSHHTRQIKVKCNKLLNVLKCLSYKNWALDTDQQLVVYKALIRSCMEYAPPVLLQSKNNVEMLQIIQNKALRIIFKEHPRSSSEPLHKRANLETMEFRLKSLAEKYWANCKDSGNELIKSLNRNI